LRGNTLATVRFDGPAVLTFIEGRGSNFGLELDVPSQVETVRDVVQVAQNLGLRA
jgi:hypothetical protein